ncbi:MAG TPA: hypothetical protein VGZ02_06415 [Candidatus Baltobacteraceae bacterium]|jgi:hypothetical protein|nr:hypothetical protein [Candidatus Baltobacteraceae bacterium]
MNTRFTPLLALALTALTGCAGTLAPAGHIVGMDQHAVQAVIVQPASLRFLQSGAANSQTFQAFTQFAGDITAVSSNNNCATVNPPSEPVGTPPTSPDGVKSATFTVTPVGAGRCTITVTDKKGNTADVTVLFFGD